MFTYIIAGIAIALGVGGLLAFFILKRAFKWAFRAALLGMAVTLMMGGGGLWWWRSASDKKPRQTEEKPRPQAEEKQQPPGNEKPRQQKPQNRGSANRRPRPAR